MSPDAPDKIIDTLDFISDVSDFIDWLILKTRSQELVWVEDTDPTTGDKIYVADEEKSTAAKEATMLGFNGGAIGYSSRLNCQVLNFGFMGVPIILAANDNDRSDPYDFLHRVKRLSEIVKTTKIVKEENKK